MKMIKVSCGTCRHPQLVGVSHIKTIDDQGMEFVSLELKPKHWIHDTWGDRQWHGWVVAERSDVVSLLRLPVSRRPTPRRPGPKYIGDAWAAELRTRAER